MPHPRNAGYRRGENWQCCPVCGYEYRASDFRTRWDGLVVCKYDWEPRHPQDFLRSSTDDMTPAVSTGACCGPEISSPVCPALLAPFEGQTVSSDTTALLKFGEIAGISSYAVYIWEASSSKPSSPTATVTGSPYVATGLTVNTEYRWSVNAIHEGVESQECGFKTFSTRFAAVFTIENGTVTRSGNVQIDATVDYTFTDLYAENGVDYTGVDGTLTFTAGQTTADVPYTVEPLELVTEWAVPVLHDWVDDNDPRNDKNIHTYSARFSNDNLYSEANFSTAVNLVVGDFPYLNDAGNADAALGYSVYAFPDDAESRKVSVAEEVGITDRGAIGMHFNRTGLVPTHPTLTYESRLADADSSLVCGEFLQNAVDPDSGLFWWSGLDENGNKAHGEQGLFGFFELQSGSLTSVTGRSFINNCTNYPVGGGGIFPKAYVYNDVALDVTRFPGAPTNPCEGFPAFEDDPNFCVLGDDSLERDEGWTLVTGSFKCVQVYVLEGNTSFETLDSVTALDLPQGPIRPVGDADDVKAFWDAAEAAAVLAGTVPAGRTYNASGASYANRLTEYPVATPNAYRRQYYPFKNFRIDLSNPQGGAVLQNPGSQTIVIEEP